ncbi:hypothetical protein [Allobranchiibius huperziae]|uniref:HEPN/Toprim N-terminal domain-containing protein n=1 Tax=Allobranchiibius huperziae TaxID=1874116 RepID=A0A853DE21_9MICO|nr:hypothetical protein [Allobranchiibius huperziae]NYJ73181.1 hypothetical protein [Allobranchiibius huperziae]
MSSYATFRLGNFEFGQIRNEVDPEVLAVFTDDMLERHTESASDYYPWWRDEYPTDAESSEADHPVAVVRLAGPGPVIAARLDLMGITATEVKALLEESISSLGRRYEDNLAVGGNEYFAQYVRNTVEVASSLTVSQWQEKVCDLDAAEWSKRPFAPGSAGWMLDLIEYWEWRHVLRLLLTVWPEEQVVLDLTDLNDGGWIDDTLADSLASGALAFLRSTASAHTPIVVLTEGRTDAEFIKSALDVLYPDLQDLITFLDYEVRPEGGAGALARSVKAFAAAGIANRVVALFDNDAAARDAMRSLDIDGLPKNIVVCRYPDTELASNYPTLGPPTAAALSGHIEHANVNGLAGSIELYLGTDVLTQEDGALAPVQWRSFIQSLRAYQGEIIGKERVHKLFRLKVENYASSGGFDEAAWHGLRSILDVIISAFLDRALPEQLCEHGGRSEARIRVRQI